MAKKKQQAQMIVSFMGSVDLVSIFQQAMAGRTGIHIYTDTLQLYAVLAFCWLIKHCYGDHVSQR